ncbi:hypothetical protein KHA96_12445 [Bacillus sp. FJAT-49711]|uniref:hypothetical protein n=1 Tax=Bacillus sp. FJAT-49711 TaxID=2833585 RepID=UPI001BC99728|nr:hypothetical protein [Bacillus sp. FJAT-49711]MBS4219126.1 hypothetical protein [Bacillus sp. FJAT-49711]
MAFENGHSHSKYFIPEEFKESKESIKLYDSLFNEGQKLRKQENHKKMMTATGVGIPVSGLAVGTIMLLRRKKKIN